MKSKEVLKLLRISRGTLHNYVKNGLIEVRQLQNGYYDYSEKSVYALINKTERLNFIYGRVSTQKQKNDLNNQIDKIKSFCFAKGILISGVYKDIGSGISFESRKDFFIILDKVMNYEVEKIVISNKDRLSRVGFGLFENLFKKFGTDIICVDSSLNEKTDAEEVFEEIISLLHCFSMRFYSKRKTSKIKEIIEEK